MMRIGEDGSYEVDAITMTWSVASDVGKTRSINEDSALVGPGLYVVADGMGGHRAGDVASSIAIEVFSEQLDAIPLKVHDVERLIAEANTRVRSSSAVAETRGMGTTLAGVALVDNGGSHSLLMFNVGDSRCYVWDESSGLRQVSHDHSVVQELVDARSIDDEDARTHPERHVVTRAIGVEPQVSADFVVLPAAERFRILLCTDGVSGEMEADSIARVMESPQADCSHAEALLAEVLEGSATDNATCVVVDVAWPMPKAADPSSIDDDTTGPRPARRPIADSTPSSPLIDSVPRSRASDLPHPAPGATIDEVPQ